MFSHCNLNCTCTCVHTLLFNPSQFWPGTAWALCDETMSIAHHRQSFSYVVVSLYLDATRVTLTSHIGQVPILQKSQTMSIAHHKNEFPYLKLSSCYRQSFSYVVVSLYLDTTYLLCHANLPHRTSTNFTAKSNPASIPEWPSSTTQESCFCIIGLIYIDSFQL